MAEKKGKKLRRSNAKTRSIYAAQFAKTETNKRRKMGRHIRHHPLDQMTIKRYEVDMGSADGHLANLTSKGAELASRAVAAVATGEKMSKRLRKSMYERPRKAKRVAQGD